MEEIKRKEPVRFTDARLGLPPAEDFQEIITKPGLEAFKKINFYSNLTVDMAHTVMLTDQDIIPIEDGAKILKTLKEIEALGPEKFPIDPALGSQLFQIETYITKKFGEDVAGKMHTGRSRTDRGAAVMRLHVRNQLLRIIEALIGFEKTLLNLADKHYDTVMPGYTHLQHAQPITFGHHLMGAFQVYNRDFERLELAYKHTNLNALGTASVAGHMWPLDRDRTMELLGFDDITQNAKDSRTYIWRAEVASTYAILMASIHSLITDFYVWWSYEFRMIEPPDEYSGSSSIMPQKKNPYVWERTRAHARNAVGWPSSALATLMGATSSDSFIQPMNIEKHGETVYDYLKINTSVLEKLIVHKERMKELVYERFSTVNNLADIIYKERGLSFRIAHHVAGRVVRICLKEGIAPKEVTSKIVDRAAKESIGETLGLSDEIIKKALDPVEFINTRVTIGSANPKDVKRQIKDGKRKLEIQENWLKEHKTKVNLSKEKLMKEMNNYINKIKNQ